MRRSPPRTSSILAVVASIASLSLALGGGNACIPHESACSQLALGPGVSPTGVNVSCDGNVLVGQPYRCDSDHGIVNDGAPTRTDCGANAVCQAYGQSGSCAPVSDAGVANDT
jgi:hypothetical protein